MAADNRPAHRLMAKLTSDLTQRHAGGGVDELVAATWPPEPPRREALLMCRAPDPGLTHERLSSQGNGRG